MPSNLHIVKRLLLVGAVFGSSVANADVIYHQDFENWSNADGLWSSDTVSALGGTYSTVLGRFGATSVTLDVLATNANTGNNNGGDSGSNPFNVKMKHIEHDHKRESFPDSTSGGGPGGPIGDSNFDIPKLDLGGAISEGTNPAEPLFGAGMYSLKFDMMLFDSWDGADAIWGPDSLMITANGHTVFNEVFISGDENDGWDNWLPDEVPAFNAFNPQYVDRIYRDIEVLIELTEESDRFVFEFIGAPSQNIIDESWGLDNIRLESLGGSQPLTAEVPVPGTLAILGGGLGLLGRRKR